MAETAYTRDLAAFPLGIGPTLFASQIAANGAITKALLAVPQPTVQAGVLKVVSRFADALSVAEEAAYDAVIAAHNPGDAPVDPVDQSYVQQESTLAAAAEVTINHADDLGVDPYRRVSVWKREPDLGTNLALAMTALDETHSTTEANLNDGNETSFAYNNSQTGPDGKSFRLDAGAPVSATHVRWFDYTTNAYGPNHYKIQGSNDNATWTDLAEVSGGSIPHMPPGSSGHLVPLGGTQSFRYWRWLCVDGENANYFIVNEFEVYNVTGTDPWVPAGDSATVKSVTAGQTIIRNASGTEKTFLVTISIPR